MSDRQVLDLLIVGGGPGGTAAAFRARELGLSALVIDYDDLMKRIRDYSKEKLILPNFGGGDKMCFPAGDALIAALRFAPIDKDDMCVSWKELYRRHRVPYRLGLELTGLERRGEIWEVQAWDHSEHSDAAFRARHVVLAIGRGVPRRFDIPGNTEGIAFRLDDCLRYVGQPACIVGGGTSAAEAVIAVAKAKVAAGDPTAVYWSYRGDKMPRVSKALAQVFFEAYVGIGNIRYYPKSEPVAVVTGDDHREYLALRVDRRVMAGRPVETAQLEFPKESCIACIGEDIPEALLGSFGISMVTGGPRGKKRMLVNRCLESRQPNIYLIGDLLSQAYFESEDFDADPAGFREVKHRGNIKSALRDGVRVAQIIQQRLAGRTEIDVSIGDVEAFEEEGSQIMAILQPSMPSTPSTEEEEPMGEAAQAFLVRVLPGGVEENEYPIAPGARLRLGRDRQCDLSFPEDTLLSPCHASIVHGDEGFLLHDEGSASGVFLRLTVAKLEIVDGDLLRAGRQFLLFTGKKGHFELIHYDAKGREVGRHPLGATTRVLGRQAPDITLDASDMTLSRRHLAISVESGKCLARDLKSANGTYLRVRSARLLEHGAQFRIGQQLFTLSLRRDAVVDPGHAPSAVVPVPSQAVASVQPVVAGSPSVTFRGLGRTLPVLPGQTLCEVAEAHGIKISAECHAGVCGSDPIRVLSGLENFEAGPGEQESETLEDICDLEPGPCRLACVARIKGPVEVEILRS